MKADTKGAYVRQPNGKVESVHRRFLLPDGVPDPGPGSMVFVPEKDMNAKSGFAQSLPTVASVLGSLVAVVVLLRREDFPRNGTQEPQGALEAGAARGRPEATASLADAERAGNDRSLPARSVGACAVSVRCQRATTVSATAPKV